MAGRVSCPLDQDPTEDRWLPTANVKTLDVFRDFMASDIFLRFKRTPEFQAFAKRWPRSVLKLLIINNNNNRRLVTLAEHTSDHGRQTNSSTEEKGEQV